MLNGYAQTKDTELQKPRCSVCNSVLYIPTIRKRSKDKRAYVSIPIHWCDECKQVREIEK